MHELITIKNQPSGKSKKLRWRVVYVPTLIEKVRTEDEFARRNNLLAVIHPKYCVRAFLHNDKDTEYEVSFSTDEWAYFNNTR